MRTTYVVLLLTILGAASSYGFDLGVQMGVRDWLTTSEHQERVTPQVVLTVGRYLTPESPIHLDAVANAWTRQEQTRGFVPVDPVPVYRSEKAGYAFGLRCVVDSRIAGVSSDALVKPHLGVGYVWAVEKYTGYGNSLPEYWYDRMEFSGVFGLQRRTGSLRDLLFQYSIAIPVDLGIHGVHSQPEAHSILLGYRFSVM